jgi:ATP-dependent helicase/nuclease subunit B
LVEALSRLALERPLDRKLVVAPTFGGGRELLRHLALHGGGWVGFEVATPRLLALRVAGRAMDERGLVPLDALDQQALLDEAMDSALQGRAGPSFRELSEGVGFRAAVHDAVTALRIAGLESGTVRDCRTVYWRKRAFLAQVVARYERLLEERRRADTATVLSLACDLLQERSRDFPDVVGADAVVLVPGLGSRGLTGRLLDALHWGGAQVLPTDPVIGMDPPRHLLWYQEGPSSGHAYLHAPEAAASAGRLDIDLFRAGSIADELREVLRRIAGRGLRWDQVEIVAADPAAYGSALHAISVRLGIPVTYAVGLPAERTRPGRVARAYLEWVKGGFQAETIRGLLEAGDLRPPRTRTFVAPADLARRFRSLRIGWGRKRYRQQIRDALDAVDSGDRRPVESEESYRRRRETARTELQAIRSVIFPALKATPSVPDRTGEGTAPVSPAELARGLRTFLRRTPTGTGPDAAARDEMMRILERVEATLRRRTHFEAAVAILQRHLEFRVRAPRPQDESTDDQGAPWRSEGGHLHLSDVEHGGFAGREEVFVVGVDADRVPGPGTQDPVLLDSERRALGEDLPTSTEIMRERAFRFAAFFSRLRGRVTFSYSGWSAADARTVAPSPLLLQALRLKRGDPALAFGDLRVEVDRVCSAFPAGDAVDLDRDDVWMRALGDRGVLRSGVDAVRAAFSHLDDGLRGAEARMGPPGPHQGLVRPRPEELDPRRNDALVVSASRLESLGTCPLRYLFASVLRLYPPDDPELDPDQWLDAPARGTLLHRVFERTLRSARDAGVQPGDAAFMQLALDALEAESARMRRDIPAPGDGVRRREMAAHEEDVRSFVRMVRELGVRWVALELRFGHGENDALVMEVPGGQVRLRGAIDRVDEDLEGLHVVDYKTGLARDYGSATGVFKGGRRLQHAMYAEAAERALGGEVVTGEYHFPTRRGENERHVFHRSRLARLPDLLGHLLAATAAGTFVPTDDPDDCRFCDFAEVCRARAAGYGKTRSPMAEWSQAQLEGEPHPAFQYLRAARAFED